MVHTKEFRKKCKLRMLGNHFNKGKRWSKYKIHINKNPYYLSYLLGVIGVGDGYISLNPKKYVYCIGLYVKDKDFLINFKKNIERRYNICVNNKIKIDKRNMYSFKVSCKEIIYDILEYGNLKDFKECNEKIPKIIKESKDKRIIGNYLKAFFDSQGCVSVKYKEISAVKKNHPIIIDIQKLLCYLDIKSYIHFNHGNSIIKICDYESIRNFRKFIDFSIQRKSIHTKQIVENYKLFFNKLDKRRLYELYITKKKSIKDISNIFCVSIHKIFNFMKVYNINSRTLSQSAILRWRKNEE